MKHRTTVVASLLAAAALILSACGGNDSGSASDADFNQADVTFAQQMIAHHRQAIDMARLAQSRAEDPRVKDLATKIVAAQTPEIDTMTGWLQSWKSDVPSAGMSGMSSGMPGMSMGGQMAKLRSATGAEFDQMFLTMMIGHHRSAIEMAKKEQVDGQNRDAVALAEKIEADQTAEIATMQQLLGN